MPKLQVHANDDAEIFVIDGALSLVRRAVGQLDETLGNGLYKVKVDRAGAIREQIIELHGRGAQLHLCIDDFPAIAPIRPLLGTDRWPVENVAKEALAAVRGPSMLFLCHWPASYGEAGAPFSDMRLFPWRARKRATALRDQTVVCRTIGDRVWAAVAVEADPGETTSTFVLEMPRGGQLSRQAVLMAKDWQSRVFIRLTPAAPIGSEGAVDRPPHRTEVSIQMANPESDVVYFDQYETIEVARVALEKGRAIFANHWLVNDLLWDKYHNPIAGLTGLHLFLDGKARWAAGDKTFDLDALTAGHGGPDAFVRTVIENLRVLLSAPAGGAEPADLTALRLRAGQPPPGQTFVEAPPMFRASWEVLKENAARDGAVWIGRALWRSTGDAAGAGPYIAWPLRSRSIEDTFQEAAERSKAFSKVWRDAGVDMDREVLAKSSGLPLSIIPRRRRRKRAAVKQS